MQKNRKKILVVEDCEHIQQLCVEDLESADYECFSTDRAQEAIELIDQDEYDLLLTDFQLKDDTSQKLVEHLRQRNTTPIIVFTGAPNRAQQVFNTHPTIIVAKQNWDLAFNIIRTFL